MYRNFKIEVTNYTEAGALGDKYIDRYCDTVEEAKHICEEYDKVYYENNDGTRGNKRYKVELCFVTYKKCPNKETFFAQFEA